jgi:uncharacterized protein (TIGR02217 family)
MSFLETVRFPESISYGASGGPAFETDIVVVNSGFESRNAVWSHARARYDVAHGVKSATEMATLIAFFRAVRGRAHGFRFKDWSDYSVTQVTGLIGGGTGNGLPDAYQLNKYYVQGALYELRPITKPISATVKVYIDAVEKVGGWSLDDTTGLLTFSPLVNKTISGITKAANGVVTCTGHTYVDNDKIYITGVVGMTEVNATLFTITKINDNSFYLNVNTTGYTTYVSDGNAKKYPQPGNALTWEGEFDVPCRFDSDEMQVSIDFPNYYDWGQIPVVEIRV